MNPIERARQALEEALQRLPNESDGSHFTIEQLDLMIAAVVSRELDKRRKRRWEFTWKVIQRTGWVIAPIAGAAVIWRGCNMSQARVRRVGQGGRSFSGR